MLRPAYKARVVAHHTTLQRAVALYGRGEWKRAVWQMRVAGLRYGDVAFAALPTAWWQGFFALLHAPHAMQEAAEKALLKQSEALDVPWLPSSQWLVIYGLCLRSGFYRIGYVFRCHARQRALNGRSPLAAFRAALDMGDIAAAQGLISQLPAAQRGYAHWFIAALQAPFAYAFMPQDAPTHAQDEAYHGLMHGKRVALVGPLANGLGMGTEIDQQDVVVKTNYMDWQQHKSLDRGKRVDVSYYNLGTIQKVEQDRYCLSENHLVFAVLKSPLHLRYTRHCSFPVRAMANHDMLAFNGSYNAIPNAVLDMMRFQPAGIRVYNTDLMLTASYQEGYAQHITADISVGFISHDPLSQYNMLHCLWRHKLISGDARFVAIMKMGEKTYIDTLQDAWSEHRRQLAEAASPASAKR